jgi:hypothetical protein
MMNSHEMETGAGFDSPPFLYEIRVRGRLSSEQWAEWFDDLTVTTGKGESILRGRAVDHSALYGLLARLQDLTVPLISVKVLDADAQLKLTRQSRRNDLAISALLGLIYLTLLGGLATLTIFLAPIINPALALTSLFALLGGLAHAFWLWSDQPVWRWITYVAWPAAVVSFLIFIPVSGVLPIAVALAVVFFFVAGTLVYVLYLLRRHAEDIRQRAAGGELPLEDREEEAVERNSPSTG